MFESLNKILSALLDKTGSGWKTTAGFMAIVLLRLALHFEYIDGVQYGQFYDYALGLFALGVTHARLQSPPKAAKK